jgi:hypothetical protein
MALRLKTQWFQDARPRSELQRASAVAFTTWRVAQEMLKRMRKADFDIDIGLPYFGFLRETVIFLALVADRLAHARLPETQRADFVGALVRRLAEIYEESAQEWLGAPADGQAGWRDGFIDAFNELAGHYAEFEFDPQADEPDFAFVRYFGTRLEPLLPDKDRRWVIEQVMAAEAPEAVALVRRAMDGVFSSATRRSRRGAAVSGD